jgi:hypothetical protein
MALRHRIAGACLVTLISAPSVAADLGGATPSALVPNVEATDEPVCGGPAGERQAAVGPDV